MSRRNSAIIRILEFEYAGAKCGLNYRTPFELLVATILSAQCTDERVNRITERLFAEANTPEDFARMTGPDLAEKIKGCGLHRMKSANIIAASRKLLEEHDGRVPADFDQLVALPGVGRKTASVVLAVAFGQPAMPVDTHVHRVSNRLGLATSENVDETEKQLRKAIPKEKWAAAHHWLIWHGRKVCKARKPLCNDCPLFSLCRYVSGNEGGQGRGRDRTRARHSCPDGR